MPIYLYQHPTTGEIKEVFQKMNDVHEYLEENIRWERIFESPNASTDTQIDPFNGRDFVAKTGNKKGTVGDLWNKSQELSDKRAQKEGVDTYKETYYTNYKKIGNSEHPDIKKKKSLDKLNKMGVSVELGK